VGVRGLSGSKGVGVEYGTLGGKAVGGEGGKGVRQTVGGDTVSSGTKGGDVDKAAKYEGCGTPLVWEKRVEPTKDFNELPKRRILSIDRHIFLGGPRNWVDSERTHDRGR